jgi:hypothetical protein
VNDRVKSNLTAAASKSNLVRVTTIAVVIGLALIAIVGMEIPVVAATVIVPTSAGAQTQLVVYHGSWGFHCYQDVYGYWHCPDSGSGP